MIKLIFTLVLAMGIMAAQGQPPSIIGAGASATMIDANSASLHFEMDNWKDDIKISCFQFTIKGKLIRADTTYSGDHDFVYKTIEQDFEVGNNMDMVVASKYYFEKDHWEFRSCEIRKTQGLMTFNGGGIIGCCTTLTPITSSTQYYFTPLKKKAKKK